MKDGESSSRLERRLGDYWYFYGDFVIIVVIGWIAFFSFKYFGYESKYLPRMLYFLIAATIYAIFVFFRILMSKKLDNDMLP